MRAERRHAEDPAAAAAPAEAAATGAAPAPHPLAAKPSAATSLLYRALRPVYAVATGAAPAPHPLVRSLAAAAIAGVLLARSARLLALRLPPARFAAGAAAAAGALAALGPARGAAALLALAAAALVRVAHRHPADGPGHRVGAHGFAGPGPPENSIAALEALAAADAAGAYAGAHFPFVEIDVQETRDGHVVLFHDAALSAAAFPEGGANLKPLAALRARGLDPHAARVADVDLAELQALALGGQAGAAAPTLAEFLARCGEVNLRRSVAVEVKALRSDAARAALLDAVAGYKLARGRALAAARAPLYPPLGAAGLVAFPQLWAAAFGEFGSPAWARWAGEVRARGLAARCVHLHHLDFARGWVADGPAGRVYV
jgi:hypothetical protein